MPADLPVGKVESLMGTSGPSLADALLTAQGYHDEGWHDPSEHDVPPTSAKLSAFSREASIPLGWPAGRKSACRTLRAREDCSRVLDLCRHSVPPFCPRSSRCASVAEKNLQSNTLESTSSTRRRSAMEWNLR